MKMVLLSLISITLLSCSKGRDSNSILTAFYIESLSSMIQHRIHDIDYARSNVLIVPIVKQFMRELQEETDFTVTLFSLDTLKKSRAYEDSYIDSLFQVSKNSAYGRSERKSAIVNSLSYLYYMESYHGLFCPRISISSLISSDTIYYPRNKTLLFHNVLQGEVLDTMQKIELVSIAKYENSSETSLSTKTKEDFLCEKLFVEIMNPITKEKRKYEKTLVVRVFDLDD